MEDEDDAAQQRQVLSRPPAPESAVFSFSRPTAVAPVPKRPGIIKPIDFGAGIPGLNKSSRPVPLFGKTFSSTPPVSVLKSLKKVTQDASTKDPMEERTMHDRSVAPEPKISMESSEVATQGPPQLPLGDVNADASTRVEEMRLEEEVPTTEPEHMPQHEHESQHSVPAGREVFKLMENRLQHTARVSQPKALPKSKIDGSTMHHVDNEKAKDQLLKGGYQNPLEDLKVLSVLPSKRKPVKPVPEMKRKSRTTTRTTKLPEVDFDSHALQKTSGTKTDRSQAPEIAYLEEMHDLRAKIQGLTSLLAAKSEELLSIKSSSKQTIKQRDELLQRVGSLETDLSHAQYTNECNQDKRQSLMQNFIAHKHAFSTLEEVNHTLRSDLKSLQDRLSYIKDETHTLRQCAQQAMIKAAECSSLNSVDLRAALAAEQIRSETLSAQCDRDAGIMAEDRDRIAYLLERMQHSEEEHRKQETEYRAEVAKVLHCKESKSPTFDVSSIADGVRCAMTEQFGIIKKEVSVVLQSQQFLMRDLKTALDEQSSSNRYSEFSDSSVTRDAIDNSELVKGVSQELLTLKSMISHMSQVIESQNADQLWSLQQSFDTFKQEQEKKCQSLIEERDALSQQMKGLLLKEENHKLEIDAYSDQVEKQRVSMELLEAQHEARLADAERSFEEERAKYREAYAKSRQSDLMQLENQVQSKESRIVRLEQQLEASTQAHHACEEEINVLIGDLDAARSGPKDEVNHEMQELKEAVAERDKTAEELAIMQRQFSESKDVIAALKEALLEKTDDHNKFVAQSSARFAELSKSNDSTGDIYDFIHDTPPRATGSKDDVVEETQEREVVHVTQTRSYQLREETRAPSRSGSRARVYKKRKSK